jgi:NUBPL iron-transfer P-loop NTPase
MRIKSFGMDWKILT